MKEGTATSPSRNPLVRDFDRAVVAGRKATEIQPRSVLARTNYAMYAMYAGDFKTAIRESNVALKENPSFESAVLTVARSSVAAGDIEGGREAYKRLATFSGSGETLARLGEADLERGTWDATRKRRLC